MQTTRKDLCEFETSENNGEMINGRGIHFFRYPTFSDSLVRCAANKNMVMINKFLSIEIIVTGAIARVK